MASNCQKITHFGRGYPEISSYDRKWPRSELVFSLWSFGCRWPQNCTAARPERYVPKTYGIRNREERFSTERREKPFSPRFFANRSFKRLLLCDSSGIKGLEKRIRRWRWTTKAPFYDRSGKWLTRRHPNYSCVFIICLRAFGQCNSKNRNSSLLSSELRCLKSYFPQEQGLFPLKREVFSI